MAHERDLRRFDEGLGVVARAQRGDLGERVLDLVFRLPGHVRDRGLRLRVGVASLRRDVVFDVGPGAAEAGLGVVAAGVGDAAQIRHENDVAAVDEAVDLLAEGAAGLISPRVDDDDERQVAGACGLAAVFQSQPYHLQVGDARRSSSRSACCWRPDRSSTSEQAFGLCLSEQEPALATPASSKLQTTNANATRDPMYAPPAKLVSLWVDCSLRPRDDVGWTKPFIDRARVCMHAALSTAPLMSENAIGIMRSSGGVRALTGSLAAQEGIHENERRRDCDESLAKWGCVRLPRGAEPVRGQFHLPNLQT